MKTTLEQITALQNTVDTLKEIDASFPFISQIEAQRDALLLSLTERSNGVPVTPPEPFRDSFPREDRDWDDEDEEDWEDEDDYLPQTSEGSAETPGLVEQIARANARTAERRAEIEETIEERLNESLEAALANGVPASAIGAIINAEKRDIEADNHYSLPEHDGLLYITYTRTNGEELTDEDVHTIIAAPISQALRHFSEGLELTSIREEDFSSRTAVFSVVEATNDSVSLDSVATGAASYSGSVTFPGLGRVSARASVKAPANH